MWKVKSVSVRLFRIVSAPPGRAAQIVSPPDLLPAQFILCETSRTAASRTSLPSAEPLKTAAVYPEYVKGILFYV